MSKLSRQQLHSRKNFLSLEKHLDDNGRYQKKRATVEIAYDAEERPAQQEWNLLIHELSGSESDEGRNDDIFANIHDATLALEKQITVVEKRKIC